MAELKKADGVRRAAPAAKDAGRKTPGRRASSPDRDWDAYVARIDAMAQENREQADSILRRLGITA